MKKLMIITMLFLTAGIYSDVMAQSIAGLKSKVERLEKKLKEQQEKVEKQKAEVAKAKKAVQDEIDRGKEAAKKDPKAHGTNDELNKLRKELKEAEDQLEKDEKKLKELREDLAAAKKKLEEKLQKAVDDILKKHPIPDDEEELDEYEKKMKKLETNPRSSAAEEELRKRIQKRIDAKRKELEEQAALPGKKEHNFFGANTEDSWRRVAYEKPENEYFWSVGIQLTKWFTDSEIFPETSIDQINKQIYSDPAIFEQLFERLGGEFFTGTFSQPAAIENYRHKQARFLGITSAFQISEHFALSAALAKGRSGTTAEFPVTVIHFENGNTTQTSGIIENEQQYMSATLQGNYLFGNGFLRPTLGAGFAFQRQAASATEAVLGGERFQIATTDAQNKIRLQAQAGLRAALAGQLSMEANINAGRLENELSFGLSVGIQYNFTR